MSDVFTLNAELREGAGKGASRRLRRSGKVPAILYGAGKDAQSLSLAVNEVNKSLASEAFYSHILTLSVGKKKEQAILKDVQRHPYRAEILHMDFLRVLADQELHVNVPLHFINEEICVGVKVGGGLITHVVSEVGITCLPKDLPEYIEVDMAEVELGQTLHLSDVKLPKGVVITELTHGAEHDAAISNVQKARAADVDEDTEATGEAEDGAETGGEG